MGAVMTDRAYNRIANGLMLVGIASALLFDSGRVSHAVAGAVGIIVGIAAMALYFVNQQRAQVTKEALTQEASAKREITFVVDGVSVASGHPVVKAGQVWEVMLKQSALHAYHHETVLHYLLHRGARRARQHDIAWFGGSDVKGLDLGSEPQLSPDDVAACAVKIIQS